MALGNKKSNEQKTTPAFEEDTGGAQAAVQEEATSAETQASAGEAAEEKVTPEAQKAAGTAIAKASGGALSTNEAAAAAKAFQKELDAMRGANDFSYGNYRLFKATQGEIQESGGEEETLGKWAKVRLIGWDNHFEVSPGEQGASTKDFVAYSKDGKVIDHVIGEELKKWVGKTCDEYLEYLRTEEEFENAKKREFIDTAVALLGSESGEGPIGSVIQISLSESSMTAFSRYQQKLKDAARCVEMGIPGFSLPADPFTFYFIREAAQKGDNKWTKLKIESTLPAKI